MKFTFPASEHDMLLAPVRPEHFVNRQNVSCQRGLLFDGYSMYYRGERFPVAGCGSFTVSLAFFPLTFSAHGDGLVSCRDAERREGLEIELRKGGVVAVRFGVHELISCNAHVRPGVKNIVTVVYRDRPGWCDLFVNGVFSNRKQFPGNTVLSFPDKPWYLGRKAGREAPVGHFYGFLEWAAFEQRAMEPDEVLAMHKCEYTGIYEPETVALGMPDRRVYRNDPHRPAFHLQPPGKWMNEPHGPMYYKGWYHIFYQGNPHAPIWDHLSWGHLYSRDMIHWQDAPLALTPEGCSLAPDGIWSGSAAVGPDGVPRLYFTAGNDRAFPNQAVAMATPASEDGGRLLTWKQYPELIQTQNVGWMGEFRDPFVWVEDGTWFMLVGTGDEQFGGGNAALYSSADGISWDSHGMLVEYDFSVNPLVGHVWELPVLLPLRNEAGEVACHILLLCACRVDNDLVETPYFLGHWDAQKRSFTRLHDKARLIDLGRGVFTGPSGFVTPDGRSVLFTIAQGRRGFQEEVRSGWAHNGGLPVELFWKAGDLAVRPVREALSLKKKLLTNSAEDLAGHPGNQLLLELTARGDTAAVSVCAGEKRRTVRYDRSSRRLQVLDEQGTEIGRYRGRVDQVDIGSEPIHMECWLDHSMFEVYVNERKAVSLRNYFDEPRCLKAEGDVEALALWELESAYPED